MNTFAYDTDFKRKYASRPSVYKLWFGRKYFIWKCKALHQSVDQLAKEISRRYRLGCEYDNAYALIIDWIRHARVTKMEVEVILQSDEPEQLLICEHHLLKLAAKDDNNLNNIFEVMIPKWIPQSSVETYLSEVAPRPRKRDNKAQERPKGSDRRKVSASSRKARPEPLIGYTKDSASNVVSSKKVKSTKGTNSTVKNKGRK